MKNDNLNFIQVLTKAPRKVALIDTIGALISTILLFLIARFEPYFGIPSHTLYILSSLPISLFIFSFINSQLIKTSWKKYLSLIIIGNSTYVIASAGLIVFYFNQLTPLGFGYFSLEIIIIILIISLEYMVLKFHKK